MRAQDINKDDVLRHRTSPNYSYYKVIDILKPKEQENTKNYIVVKCMHSTSLDFSFGLIKYIRPCDLIKEKNK